MELLTLRKWVCSLEVRIDNCEKLTQTERYIDKILRDLLEFPCSCADSSSTAKESEDFEVGEDWVDEEEILSFHDDQYSFIPMILFSNWGRCIFGSGRLDY